METGIKSQVEDFFKFIFKDDVISLGVGVIIGGAFSNTVNSLVNDVFNPVLDLVTNHTMQDKFLVIKEGRAGGKYETLQDAQADGATVVKYGAFIQTVINLFVQGLCLFFIIRAINTAKKFTTTNIL